LLPSDCHARPAAPSHARHRPRRSHLPASHRLETLPSPTPGPPRSHLSPNPDQLISGARLSTLLMRLPYLPAADAYVCENGGRIFYPGSDLPTGALRPCALHTLHCYLISLACHAIAAPSMATVGTVTAIGQAANSHLCSCLCFIPCAVLSPPACPLTEAAAWRSSHDPVAGSTAQDAVPPAERKARPLRLSSR
jgi:hypothetical protein